MSNNAMGTIAAQVPLALYELRELDVLGDNVIEKYGDILIESINAFIEKNALQVYVQGNKASLADSSSLEGSPNRLLFATQACSQPSQSSSCTLGAGMISSMSP